LTLAKDRMHMLSDFYQHDGDAAAFASGFPIPLPV
jgi:hypothetical protein